MKFEVGDRVRYLGLDSDILSVTRIGIVTEINSGENNNNRIHFRSDNRGCFCNCNDEILELVISQKEQHDRIN